MKYIIKSNGKYKGYFKNEILKNVNHFVSDIEEAKVFPDKWKAKAQVKKLKHLREFNNLEIIKR